MGTQRRACASRRKTHVFAARSLARMHSGRRTWKSNGSPVLESDCTRREPMGTSLMTRCRPCSRGPPLIQGAKLNIYGFNATSILTNAGWSRHIGSMHVYVHQITGDRYGGKRTSTSIALPLQCSPTGVSTATSRYGSFSIALSTRRVAKRSVKNMKSCRVDVRSRRTV